MGVNFSDLYIISKQEARYKPNKIVENDIVNVILQKLKMCLYTNKGEALNPDLGCDLDYYLTETKLSNADLKEIIVEQINTFIPEIIGKYELSLDLYEGEIRDILYITINLEGYEYNFIV